MKFVTALRQNKRGVYFVSTLVVSVLLIMLMTTAVITVRGSLSSSQHLSGGDAALRAAESGLRYAQARLGEDPFWRGNANRVVVDSPDLIVEEREGNVIGVLRASDGEFTQFRIRFNWQDGSGGKDGFSDPPGTSWVDHPYLSYNNLLGGGAVPLPRATGPNYSVVASSPEPYDVPTGVACIQVEGRAGPGMVGLGPDNLNPSIQAKGSQVSKRVVEAYLRMNRQPGADSAAMSAGRMLYHLDNDNKARVSLQSESGLARMRSKRSVWVQGGGAKNNLESKKGEVLTQTGYVHANASGTISTGIEAYEDGFYQLTWEDVRKATNEDYTLNAGTYVVWDDGTVRYYDMPFWQYANYIQTEPNDPGIIMSFDPEIIHLEQPKSGKFELHIKDNVRIAPSGKTDEFNLIPRKGANEDPPEAPVLPEDATGPVQMHKLESVTKNLDSATVTEDSIVWNLSGNLPLGDGEALIGTVSGDLLPGAFDLILENEGGVTRLSFVDSDEAFGINPEGPANAHKQLLLASLQNTPEALLSHQANGEELRKLLNILISSSEPRLEEFKLPGVTTEVTNDDLTLKFKPEKGASAILSSPGNTLIASRVEGEGGSITSGGSLSLVGAGSDFQANIEDGLNLYSRGDITLSSLKPKKNEGEYEYKDFSMKGVIYTWGNFTAKIGHEHDSVGKWGKFKLDGALVAYGGDPAGHPGQNWWSGQVTTLAKEVKLNFDPAYLVALQREPDPGPLHQTFYMVK